MSPLRKCLLQTRVSFVILVSVVAEMERTSKDKLEQLLKEADVSGE